MKIRVLLVDDDVELLDVSRILLHQTSSNLEIVVADSVKSALEKIEHEKFDVIIADYLMPDSSGLELLEVLRADGDETCFIIWTGHSSEEIAIKALNLGADYYIVKGIEIEAQFKTIRDTITKILARKVLLQTQMIPQDAAGEFIHKLSHDVIGLLQNIMGYVTLLYEEMDTSYLDGIAKIIAKLNTRMKLAVSDIDNGDLAKRE